MRHGWIPLNRNFKKNLSRKYKGNEIYYYNDCYL